MLVQIFAGFPFIDQAENVLALDIPQDVMAPTTPLLSRKRNH
jgi:hypothetical protein